MSKREWDDAVSDLLGDIAGDESLSDEDYCEILEDLVSTAQSALDAKREEMEIDE